MSASSSMGAVDQVIREREPGRRVYRGGAWNLRGPGVYTILEPGRAIIGHRPGFFHYAVATFFPSVALGVIWLIGREVWWFAAGVGLLFGLLPILPLLNTQRYEVSPGLLRAGGRALGLRIDRRWPLPADSAVRVERFDELDWNDNSRWPRYQAQVKVADGWVAVAELLHDPEPVRAFARQLAEAAGVPLLGKRGAQSGCGTGDDLTASFHMKASAL